MSPDLVIFDCDGVLIDSEVLASELLVEALARVGISLSLEEVLKEHVGLSRVSSAARIEAKYGIRLPDGFWDDVRAAASERYARSLKAIPGVIELVAALRAKKCVASSSGPQTLRHALGLVGLWDYFNPYVFSSHQVKNGKPAPDLFLFAAEQMQADPSACLVIEDSVAGVRAAKAANMRVFGFAGGSHCNSNHADVLLKEGANRVFARMDDIASTLRREAA